MTEFFLEIVNRSISASWLVLAVLVLRLLLKKAPKWVNVLLWGLVAVRLVCPVSIESSLSLIPSAETIQPDIMMAEMPGLQSGVDAIDGVMNPVIQELFTPDAGASATSLQILIPVLSWLWATGMAAMLLYTAVSWFTLRRRVRTAVRYRDNIFCSENVGSPFVLGIVRPKIYLPFTLDDQTLNHVIDHEQAHICRGDHWWKPLGFLLLAVNWFNPLMYLSYGLLCRDMELACDERVIRGLGNEERAQYTQALVACSVSRRSVAACPLAFGEVGVKERVKSVMNYKKASFWIIVVSVLACGAAAVCFLTNPRQDATVTEPYDVTLTGSVYIGDAPKVSAIAQSLPYPEGCIYSSIALQTDAEPYGLTVSLHGDAMENDLMLCGAVAFQKIGNLGTITFRDADSGEEMASFMRVRKEELKCYLIIGDEGIAEIDLEMPGISGGCINADGSTFRKGEKIWLEQLDGYWNLQGLKITALDQQGNTVWKWVVQDVWPWNALTLSDADNSICVKASETGTSYVWYAGPNEDRWELTNVK